jgi:hypothetical protein
MIRRTLLLATAALLIAATSAWAASAKNNYRYSGKTSQGIAVRLAQAGAGGRWFRYRAKMTCNDGSTFLDDYFSDQVTVKNNRFSVSNSSSAGAVRTKVTGTLSGIHASGTIRIIERYSELPNANGDTPLAANGAIVCDSGTVRWTATA